MQSPPPLIWLLRQLLPLYLLAQVLGQNFAAPGIGQPPTLGFGQAPSFGAPSPTAGDCSPVNPAQLLPLLEAETRVVFADMGGGRTMQEAAEAYACTAARSLQAFKLYSATTGQTFRPANDSLAGKSPTAYSSMDLRFTLSVFASAASSVLGGEGFNPSTIALSGTYIIAGMKQAGFSLDSSFLLWTQFRSGPPGAPPLPPSEDFSTTLQVTGPNLLPFTDQKQTIILTSLQQRFVELAAGKNYVLSLNISEVWNASWPAPAPVIAAGPGPAALEAAATPGAANAPLSRGTGGARRSLRQADSISNLFQSLGVRLWTGVAPAGVNTPSQLYAAALGSELEGLLAAAGLPNTAIRLINSTMYQRVGNGSQVIVKYDPPLPAPAPAPGPAASVTQRQSAGKRHTGAIVGGSVGAAAALLLLAAVLALLVCRRQRKRRNAPLAQQQAGGPGGAKKGTQGTSPRKPWEIPPGELTLSRLPDGEDHVLGYGNFGRVVKGVRNGVQEVAVKIMNRQDPGAEQELVREAAMMKHVSLDRNIVQFYGTCRSQQDGAMWMVVEFMEGGDLRNALTNDKSGRLGWYARGKAIALDITRGLVFLHASNVTHRDIKSKNILLTKDGTAKIADVGMAKITAEGYFTRDNALGTFAWAAPELLLGDRCTEKVDVFSLGVCLWEVCTQEMPQRGLLRTPEVPKECPQEVVDIIDACMQRDAKLRPSALEVYRMLRSCAPRSNKSSPRGSSGDSPAGSSQGSKGASTPADDDKDDDEDDELLQLARLPALRGPPWDDSANDAEVEGPRQNRTLALDDTANAREEAVPSILGSRTPPA